MHGLAAASRLHALQHKCRAVMITFREAEACFMFSAPLCATVAASDASPPLHRCLRFCHHWWPTSCSDTVACNWQLHVHSLSRCF